MLSKKAVIGAIMALLILGAAGIATFGKFTLAAVNLVWFKATAGDGEVLVEWLTHSEIDNAGFNLYRTTSEGGPYTRINDSLITSASLGSNAGGYYAYTDNDVFSGITYYYILESVATDGFTELYGPVSATLDGQPTATPSPTPIWGDITDVRMSDTPGGPEMPQFPSGTSVVYVVIDYYEMHGERYRIRVYDNVGTVLLEEVRAFTESGTESIEVSGPEGGAFPNGRYLTNLYNGLFPIKSIIWQVGEVYKTFLPCIVKQWLPLITPTPTAPLTATPTPLLTLTPTPGFDLYEPNDSFSIAYPILSGETYFAYINPGFDLDYFLFHIRSTYPITVRLTIPDPESMTYGLDLYDADYYCLATKANLAGEEMITLTYDPSQTGKYFVKVYSVQNRFDPSKTYELRVVFDTVSTPTPSPTLTPTMVQPTTGTPTSTAIPCRLYLPLIVKDDAPPPSLKDAHMSDTPYGPAVINFPSGIGVVYTILEYENLRETLLGVRAYDNVGNVLFEQMKEYSGSGVESVRIASETGVFADDRYVTNIYIGMAYRGAYPFLAKTLLWAVGEEWQWPTATFTPEVPVVTVTPVPPTNTPLPTPTPTVIPARNSHSLSRNTP